MKRKKKKKDINCEGRPHVPCYLLCLCYTLHCTNKNNLQITISHAMEVGLTPLTQIPWWTLSPSQPHILTFISSFTIFSFSHKSNCFCLLLPQFQEIAANESNLNSRQNQYNKSIIISTFVNTASLS